MTKCVEQKTTAVDLPPTLTSDLLTDVDRVTRTLGPPSNSTLVYWLASKFKKSFTGLHGLWVPLFFRYFCGGFPVIAFVVLVFRKSSIRKKHKTLSVDKSDEPIADLLCALP
jgi:hypothetical protein